jgi:hypothetical protein
MRCREEFIYYQSHESVGITKAMPGASTPQTGQLHERVGSLQIETTTTLLFQRKKIPESTDGL